MVEQIELKRMVVRIIELGKLLAEAERQTFGEHKKKDQTERKRGSANDGKKTS